MCGISIYLLQASASNNLSLIVKTRDFILYMCATSIYLLQASVSDNLSLHTAFC